MKAWISSRWLLLWVLALPWIAYAQNYSRTERTAYHDNLSKWVLGQVEYVVCMDDATHSGLCNGNDVMSQTAYDAVAMPWKTYAFGKLQQTMTYNADGTLASVSDGRDTPAFDTTILLSGWKRGVPQQIQFPATSDHPITYQRAGVDDNGWIDWVTDENGFKTCYEQDVMGRLSKIIYPNEASPTTCAANAPWAPTTIAFAPSPNPGFGMPAGYWRQTVTTGNGATQTTFDALWRPVVKQTYDASSAAITSATLSQTITRYDSSGRVSFASYPQRNQTAAITNTWANPAVTPNAKGTTTSYDALDRVLSIKQDAEAPHGVLTTQFEYLTGFRTRVTPPSGLAAHQTTTKYVAYDEPTTDWPDEIDHPEGAFTKIVRDVFGKPTSVTRHNHDSSLAVTRSYTYDTYQQLCRTVEPESDATLYGYDAAGNLTWSASGLPTTTACDAEGDTPAITARSALRLYDNRNRLKELSFPDGRGDQLWTYTPDGLPETIVTDNAGGGDFITNFYFYNKRRLLDSERLWWDEVLSWPITYGYNANGHLASQGWHGLTVTYAPNALGQATQVGSNVGTFASGVSYWPNGALHQFTYGNGIVHTMTQNDRQLPATSVDTGILDDSYVYDKNGNVTAKWDGTPSGWNGRTMLYDGLNRLTKVNSPILGGDAFYSYDALDNLTSANVRGRDDLYCYGVRNRLGFIRTGTSACSGDAVPAHTVMYYDLQGNLASKNETDFTFDFGNRLRSVSGTPSSTYVYDGHGRRVRDVAAQTKLSQYNHAGQLTFGGDSQTVSEYFYLAGSLLAIRNRDGATGAYTTRYQHTDALGTPMAVTGGAGALISRTYYEPYGKAFNGPASNGPGYTGHVLDLATGMNYMQQRYYDPEVGRFLSVDPVKADGNTGGNFNRYKYAANNPYRFTDPDGRLDREFNLENKRLGTTPPPRSDKDWLGPAIGVALTVVSAPAIALGGWELGMAAYTSPLTTVAIVNEIGAAAGVTGIAGGLNQARSARDALAGSLAPLKGKAPATVTGGFNTRTGETAARACGGGNCAETNVVNALGGNKGEVRFTEAVRPRTGAEVPVCSNCEATYGRGAFPPETKFQNDR